MSVSLVNYIVIGVKLPYTEFNEETLDKFYDNPYSVDKKEGLVIISDGMCGKYTYVGKILLKQNGKSYKNEGLDCIQAFQNEYENFKQAIWNCENEEVRGFAGHNVSLFAFSHFH